MTDSKLEQAFDELLNRGWNSSKLLNTEDSTVCALGALALAHGMKEEALSIGGPSVNEAYQGLNYAHAIDIRLLSDVASAYLEKVSELSYANVYTFNDTVAKSEDDVKRLIKSAIELRDN